MAAGEVAAGESSGAAAGAAAGAIKGAPGAPMGLGTWLVLGAIACIWSGSFFFNAIALRDLPPFVIVWCRVAIASIALLPVLRLLGLALPRDAGSWAHFVLLGTLNSALPFALIVWGQREVSSGLAAILNATTPLFGVLVAHVASDERAMANRLVGVLIGIVGVAWMIGPDAASGRATLPGELACLVASFSYACGSVYTRTLTRGGLPPMTLATGQMIGAAAVLLFPALLLDRPWLLAAPSGATLFTLAGLGVLSSAVAYWLFFRLIAGPGATTAQLVTFLVPIGALLLGTLFLGEHVLPRHLAGMATIGCALALIDGRVLRLLRRVS